MADGKGRHTRILTSVTTAPASDGGGIDLYPQAAPGRPRYGSEQSTERIMVGCVDEILAVGQLRNRYPPLWADQAKRVGVAIGERS